MNSPVVLLVAVDQWTAQIVSSWSQELGCSVVSEPNGEAALQLLRRHRPDLVVMDISPPDMEGLVLCRQMRVLGNPLLVVLTSATDAKDRIAALEYGADDCLTRPFNPRELLARMRALLRRSRLAREHARYTFPGLAVDPSKRTVTVDERKVDLREREFDLLLELVRQPGTVVTREELLRRVWGYDYPVAGQTLDVHVHRLRTKLGDNGRQTRFIETIKGVGYRFREEPLVERTSVEEADRCV
jgi:DNA-binding response OmpR family regulator